DGPASNGRGEPHRRPSQSTSDVEHDVAGTGAQDLRCDRPSRGARPVVPTTGAHGLLHIDLAHRSHLVLFYPRAGQSVCHCGFPGTSSPCVQIRQVSLCSRGFPSVRPSASSTCTGSRTSEAMPCSRWCEGGSKGGIGSSRVCTPSV